MFENKIFLLSISTVIAFIPILIWLYFITKKSEQSKKTVLLIFALGCLTAPAMLLMQVLWAKFPQFDLAALIDNNIKSQSLNYIAMIILFGIMEEIVKMLVIIGVDKKTLLIQTVNATIKYSIISVCGVIG